MKSLIAVFLFAAIAAQASIDVIDEFVGNLQDSPDGEIVRIGNFADGDQPPQTAGSTVPIRIESCKKEASVGNLECFTKCTVGRGLKGGACRGDRCICTRD